MSDTVIKIGGVETRPVSQKQQRISLLVWGPSGVGKTTLACTLPGRKLLISFDPDGDASVAERDDVTVADMSQVKNSTVDQFKNDANPLGITKALEHFDSIIIDSLTNAQHMATMHAVTVVKGATIERPSLGGYGHRNALITQLVKNVLRVTAKHNKHVAFVAHEASPQLNDNGVVIAITLALGGQLVVNAPVDFSEVWHLSDTGKSRRIAIRPVRSQKPMKTRMFTTTGSPEFEWKYDKDNIDTWFCAWQDSGWKKQPLPT